MKNKLLDIKIKNKNINDKELEIAKIIKIQTKKESRLPYRKRRELALKQLNETNVNEYLNLMNNDIILFDIFMSFLFRIHNIIKMNIQIRRISFIIIIFKTI